MYNNDNSLYPKFTGFDYNEQDEDASPSKSVCNAFYINACSFLCQFARPLCPANTA